MSDNKKMILAGVLGAVLLAGCGDDVTMYEPGVYKGKQDEAATEEAAERRADALRDRAQTGFADR